MSDSSFYKEVAKLTEKDLGTSSGEILPALSGGIDREFIKTRLSGVIDHMLDNEFEKLCNTFYRLDVSEAAFHHVLESTPKEKISGELADLVIDREIMKVRTRQLYRDNKL